MPLVQLVTISRATQCWFKFCCRGPARLHKISSHPAVRVVSGCGSGSNGWMKTESSSELSKSLSAALSEQPLDSIAKSSCGENVGRPELQTLRPPAAAIGRMSLYLRELHRLEDSAVTSISSRDLAKKLDVSADVVRRDLAWLGSVGRRGVGYDVSTLATRLRAILGSNTDWRVVLVGTGSLGHALLRYRGFERLGFQLVAALDVDPRRIGEKIGGVTIEGFEKMAKVFQTHRPQLAILAVPAEAAAGVATSLTRAGISGILNFAPTALKLPKEVRVVNVDLATEIQRLAFHVSQQTRQNDAATADVETRPKKKKKPG